MHDIRWIRENPDAFDQALARRGLPGEAKRLIALDERRRAAIQKAEAALARRNAASKEIGAAKKSNEEATAQKLLAEVAELKNSIPALEAEEKKLSKELDDALAQVPNLPLPAPEVPDGKDANDNIEHHYFGATRSYGFAPKQHFDLGEALGQMDFETAAKLSGARFVVLKKGLARMERALGQFMLDLHTNEHGYTEVQPPLLVKDEALYGTAQLPKFAEDQFHTGRSGTVDDLLQALAIEVKQIWAETEPLIPGGIVKSISGPAMRELLLKRLGAWTLHLSDSEGGPRSDYFDKLIEEAAKKYLGLWLIPTAEVPLTNLVREQILDEASLPLRY